MWVTVEAATFAENDCRLHEFYNWCMKFLKFNMVYDIKYNIL